MSKFILMLVFLAPSLLFSSESSDIHKIIYDLEINEITKRSDCLSKLYIESTITSKLNRDNLRACISESDLVGRYYLHLASYNDSIYKLNYQQAIKSLELAQQVRMEVEKKNNKSNVDDELASDKIQLLSLQNAKKNNEIIYIKKKEKKFIYDDPLTGQEFLFDTGSLFWSVKPGLCINSTDKSINVSGSNGSISEFRICVMSTHHYSGYALVAEKNIAGLMLALSKRSVIFGNETNEKKRRVKFYFDNDLIIINDSTTINNVKYNINSCIDSGAKNSFITPKMYKNIRKSIKESKIIPLMIDSFTGENSTYGRVIRNFSSDFFILKDIYAISNGDVMHPCDLVIGNDYLLENIIELNISERELVLRHELHN